MISGPAPRTIYRVASFEGKHAVFAVTEPDGTRWELVAIFVTLVRAESYAAQLRADPDAQAIAPAAPAAPRLETPAAQPSICPTHLEPPPAALENPPASSTPRPERRVIANRFGTFELDELGLTENQRAVLDELCARAFDGITAINDGEIAAALVARGLNGNSVDTSTKALIKKGFVRRLGRQEYEILRDPSRKAEKVAATSPPENGPAPPLPAAQAPASSPPVPVTRPTVVRRLELEHTTHALNVDPATARAVIEQRDLRRTTGNLMGDPPPGRSALDEKLADERGRK